MKRSLVIAPLLVVIAAAAILFLGGPTREFTTSSSEAYDLFQEGYAQVNAFQFSNAETSLTRAVEIDPDFAMARALLARVYMRTFRNENADEQIAIADSLRLGLTNKVEQAKVEFTLCAMREGNRSHRDSLLAFLVSEEPDNLLVLEAQGANAFDNDREASRKIFLKILDIEPNHAPAYNMLGYLAAHDGRYADAETYLRKYAFLAPGLANPHDSLGEILSWLGNYDEAERELLTALNIDNKFHYSLINLGRLYLDQGRIKKGESILEKVRPFVEGTPDEQRIDQYLIRAFDSWELYDRANARIQAFIDKYPSEVTAGFYQALLLAIEGDLEGGQATLDDFMVKVRKQVAQYENERASLSVETFPLQYQALALTFGGNHEEAVGAWTAFLEARTPITPRHDHWWVYWRLGRSQLAIGDSAGALKSARAAIDPNPNRINPLMLLAKAALDEGERGLAFDAIQSLEPLIARADPDLPVQAAFLELKAQMDAVASR